MLTNARVKNSLLDTVGNAAAQELKAHSKAVLAAGKETYTQSQERRADTGTSDEEAAPAHPGDWVDTGRIRKWGETTYERSAAGAESVLRTAAVELAESFTERTNSDLNITSADLSEKGRAAAMAAATSGLSDATPFDLTDALRLRCDVPGPLPPTSHPEISSYIVGDGSTVVFKRSPQVMRTFLASNLVAETLTVSTAGNGLCGWARQSLTNMREWLFPPAREIPDCLEDWLDQVFPGTDLANVYFHEGLPPLIKISNPNAIALPGLFGTSDIHIYFPDGFDPCRCGGRGRGLRLIGHEMVHVRQYRDYAGGYGLGFLRAFMFPYLLCVVRHGYRNHPLEQEAKAFEGEIAACCTTDRVPCDCSTGNPQPNPTGLSNWISNCSHVQFTETRVGFWDHLWRCVPGLEWWWDAASTVFRACGRLGEPRRVIGDGGEIPIEPGPTIGARIAQVVVCPFTTLLAVLMWTLGIVYFLLAQALLFAVIVAIAIVWPVLNVLYAVATGIWAVVVGILCLLDYIWRGIRWLWERIRDGFRAVCDWAETLERRCVRWETQRRRECRERETRRRRECRERETRRRRECRERETRRRRECTERAERRRRECCTWWPCSWGCNAWTWIVETVCVAWTWIVETVCVAWAWVTEVVCVAWSVIVETVCVAWTWVVTRVCTAFTWVVTGATCWAR